MPSFVTYNDMLHCRFCVIPAISMFYHLLSESNHQSLCSQYFYGLSTNFSFCFSELIFDYSERLIFAFIAWPNKTLNLLSPLDDHKGLLSKCFYRLKIKRSTVGTDFFWPVLVLVSKVNSVHTVTTCFAIGYGSTNTHLLRTPQSQIKQFIVYQCRYIASWTTYDTTRFLDQGYWVKNVNHLKKQALPCFTWSPKKDLQKTK
jgi:hypothetical protein